MIPNIIAKGGGGHPLVEARVKGVEEWDSSAGGEMGQERPVLESLGFARRERHIPREFQGWRGQGLPVPPGLLPHSTTMHWEATLASEVCVSASM